MRLFKKRDTTPHVINRWHKHVHRVEVEIKNAAAPPAWWRNAMRMLRDVVVALARLAWRGLRVLFEAPSMPDLHRVPAPAPRAPYQTCTHAQAMTASLRDVVGEALGNSPLAHTEASWCPTCGMTVAVLR